MKIAAILLLTCVPLATAAIAGNKKCGITDGNSLRQFADRKLPIKAPCKFNAIHQRCGDYRVWVTPGLKFLYPRYIIDTVWFGVNNTKTGDFWEGRTTNKLTAMHIVEKAKGGERDFFNKKNGTYTTEELFDVTSTTHAATLTEKSGVFSLTVGAYDFNGNKDHDSTMEFVCNVDNDPSVYPTHFCGSNDGKEIKTRAETLFGSKKDVELVVMFDVFNDSTVVQKDGCKDANRIMTQVCKDDKKRAEAIETCHHILDSTGHTKCVLKYACDPLDVFVNCLQYVCSDYTDKAACETVGQAIDLCRKFPGLTDKVKADNCYKDFMTAEDNPHYKPSPEEDE